MHTERNKKLFFSAFLDIKKNVFQIGASAVLALSLSRNTTLLERESRDNYRLRMLPINQSDQSSEQDVNSPYLKEKKENLKIGKVRFRLN